MPQPYYAKKTELTVGSRKGETVYSAQPCYNGTISTRQMATQIAQESALTQADVIGVMERMAYFCQTHMALGYKISLDGLGTFRNKFVTSGTVNTPEEVTAKLIRSIRPAFSPEYTIINGSFRYALMPEKTELTRVDFRGVAATDVITGGGDDENSEDSEDSGEGPLG